MRSRRARWSDGANGSLRYRGGLCGYGGGRRRLRAVGEALQPLYDVAGVRLAVQQLLGGTALADRAFDTVVSVRLISHMQDWHGLVDELYSSVTPPYGNPKFQWGDQYKVYDMIVANPQWWVRNVATEINSEVDCALRSASCEREKPPEPEGPSKATSSPEAIDPSTEITPAFSARLERAYARDQAARALARERTLAFFRKHVG